MKIKAIYKYTYGHDEEEVLIIGVTDNYEFACIDKFGHLFFASKRELSVIDERYLQELK